MTPRLALVLLLTLAAASVARAASGAQETALQRRYAEVRSRIDALFQHRDTPPPAISVEDNPFIVGSTAQALAAPAAPGIAPPRAAAPAPTFTKLQLIAATFRITGLVRVGATSQLVVNSAPRKAGDIISVMWQGSPVFVRLTRFEPGLATFSLDGENVTLRY
ncbi:MAG TPA: hypothetical protein VGD88_01145 [Opitutaceae bacterium]